MAIRLLRRADFTVALPGVYGFIDGVVDAD
jgi:hypothetical protein